MSVVEVIEASPKKQISSEGYATFLKKKVCAYCRVSTDFEDQVTSYNSQINHYSSLIKNNPEWIFAGVYADEGISGTQTKKRKMFNQMIEDCKKRKIDIIIAKSISRFARNTVDTLNYVRMLRGLGIDVYFEKENIHTLSMNNELFLTLYSAFAQGESESTSENVRLGFKAKMKRGEPCGRIACYGFYWDKENQKILINEKEAQVIRKIFKLYLSGLGSTRICKELEKQNILTAKGGTKWHATVIKDILKNEKYAGDLCGQKSYISDPITHTQKKNRGEKAKYYVKDHHDAIVSREDFNKVQEIYKKRSIKIKDGHEYCEKFSMRYTLSSRIKCGNCGSNYVRRITHYTNKQGDTHSYVYWICSCKKGLNEYCGDRVSIRESELKKLFIDLFNKIKGEYDNGILLNKINSYIKDFSENNGLDELNRKNKEINEKISRLLDMKLNRNIDECAFDNKYKELQDELEDNKIRKEQIKLELDNTEKQHDQLSRIEKVLQTEEIKKFDDDVFNNLVKYVIIGGKEENGEYNPGLVRFVFNIDFSMSNDISNLNSFPLGSNQGLHSSL